MKEQTLGVDPNAPFKRPKGLRLFPTGKVGVLLPGAVVKERETLASVIEAPDHNARIEFQESKDKREPFACIILELEPGASVRLHRAAEALTFSDSEGPIIFRMEGKSES